MSHVSDPSTYWLTFTNIALGVVTVICCAAVAGGILQEILERRRKRAALAGLDSEVAKLVHSFDGHAFDVPGLGVVMADGGERIDKKEER